MEHVVEATQLFATLWMTGLIWFVQLVHYPLFHFVERAAFADFEHAHQQRTTIVVAPIMCLELGAAVLWLWYRSPAVPAAMAVVGLVLVVLLWLTTFLVQVPAHSRLLHGYDATVHRRLVWSNWIRTVMWSCRGILVTLAVTM